MRRLVLCALALPVAVAGLAGCGTTVTFKQSNFSPLAITASPPAPPPPPRKVEKINIPETIQFATGKARIKRRSYKVLDGVVKVMKDRPGIKKVRIEGHTDSRGDADKNRTLSQKRAESVMRYLIKKGIAANRLEAKGYGPDKPIADNDTDGGRAKNRRVEFTILEQEEK